MKDQSRTKQELIKELAALRRKIVELESMRPDPAPIDHRQRQHAEGPEKGPSASSKIQVSGINVAWDAVRGTCTFEDLPVVMMWVDATLAGLMSGVQAMVGTERFFLSLQSEGRKSVEADWQVISQYPDFRDGFTAIANIAAAAGWGYWELASLDTERRECHFRIRDSWEGRYQRSLGVCWGSGMLAGKMAGYCTKLFGTNCWADQTHFIAKGDNCDEFFVQPSPRSIENEIEDLLASGEATRADMAVALKKLEKEITERKHAEDALRESEKKYREFADLLPQIVFETNMQGIITFVNRSALAMSGYTQEDVEQGINMLDTIIPEDRERARESLKELLASGMSLGNEYTFLRKDGSTFPVIIHTSTVIRDGHVVGLRGFAVDITDRRRTEEALRESEGKFRDLAEKSMVGIYLYQDGVFKYVNVGLADIFGYTPEEIIDRLGLKDVIHPADLQMVQENVRQRLSGEKRSKRYEFRAITKNGDVKHVEVYGSRTLYLGKPAVIGMVLDVTDRRKAEADLRRLNIAIEQAAEDIIITDPDGVIQYVNPAFEKITGYSRMEAIGKNPRFLKSGAHEPAFYEGLWKTIKSGKIWSGRITNRRSDGTLIQEDATISPLVSSSGALMGYVALKRDVSDTVKLESQLIQSQKMEAIGTLAGGIAHDFNNILTALIGYGNILQMKMKEDDPLWVYVEQILASSEKAANLTQSLLAFSRKQAVELKPKTVNTIIGGIEKLLKRLLTEDITLTIILPDNDLTIMADITQIDQVLMNLVTNARDAMPRGGTLTIEVKESTIDNAFIIGQDYGRPGAYALISVTDTGIGMDKQTQERIFDPFFTTKEVGKGTGLGLSTVYGIIKQHNGSIHVESEPGRGSTFRIYLPVVSISVQHKKAVPLPMEGGTETILLAEDNQVVRDLTKEILTMSGYTVIEAVDGEDAIRKFIEHKDTVGLMLVDVVMPKKNGKEVYEEIVKVVPNAKVIFMSGYTGDVVLEKGVFEDAIDFIKKPLVPNELLLKIRTVLNR